ncbi:mechanosensitive ion channel domain-containing protein [Tepidiphilus thermophilus]|uniref:Mechanosensitive ion channel n=1 Tax=Tepidiphilus thermophilus TaxID=876478 RepID=A0A0K6IYE5_9PROT|nr:mechanosensitive ion channel domain-containing protein [Tepidiphilus thermophilus]CUB08135.1 Mechanosensitive ion channel [Tepidiphilus thermophilus]
MVRFRPCRSFLPLFLFVLLCFASFAPWASRSALAAEATAAEDKALYAQLAAALEDPAARDAMIRELRRLAEQGRGGETVPPVEQSAAQRLAHATQRFVQDALGEFESAFTALRTFDWAGGGDPGWRAIGAAVLDLTFVVAVTVLVLVLGRRMLRALFVRLDAWSCVPGTMPQALRRTLAVFAAVALDLLAVLAAWVSGYLAAVFFFGEPGSLAPRHTLYLNAFVLVEAVKVLLRALFAPGNASLRLLPMPEERAAYWSARSMRLASFLGYGLLFVVPLVEAGISPALGRVLALAVMLATFVFAVSLIVRNRAQVRRALEAAAGRSKSSYVRFTWNLLARSWHLLTIVYCAALLMVALARPQDALPFMMRATVTSLVALLLGVLVSATLTQLLSRRIRLPDEMQRKFPLLENRLNAYVPLGLRFMRLLIALIVFAAFLHVWGVFDLKAWLASPAGTATLSTLLSVLLVLVLAVGAWLVFASWVEYRLTLSAERGQPGAREKTLLSLIRNAVAVVLVVMTVMIVLSQLGIQIGPLLAGAGVLGLAVGFGAQKLVEDVINGLFIQIENVMSVGDTVTVAGITGRTLDHPLCGHPRHGGHLPHVALFPGAARFQLHARIRLPCRRLWGGVPRGRRRGDRGVATGFRRIARR